METDTVPLPTQRPVPEFSDSRLKTNASSDHGEREQTLSSSDRIDRHIVTSYQITRGEVCISSSSTTVRNLSQDIQESSVADPDQPDPHDFGPPGSRSIRGMDSDPDPDPSIIMQK